MTVPRLTGGTFGGWHAIVFYTPPLPIRERIKIAWWILVKGVWNFRVDFQVNVGDIIDVKFDNAHLTVRDVIWKGTQN